MWNFRHNANLRSLFQTSDISGMPTKFGKLISTIDIKYFNIKLLVSGGNRFI